MDSGNSYAAKLESAGKSIEDLVTRYGFGGRLGCAGMSIEEAARFLGIGRSLTYAEIKSGRLKARKVGRRTIILHEDAERYLRSLPVVGAAAP
jgi:excisionase family DNA binding protein